MANKAMKKYEYKREFAPRYYYGKGREHECPEMDILKEAGNKGWLLCATGSPDTSGTTILYFVRELDA